MRWTTAQLPRRESRSRVSMSSRHHGWQKNPHPLRGLGVRVAWVCSACAPEVSKQGWSRASAEAVMEASSSPSIFGGFLSSFVWWCISHPLRPLQIIVEVIGGQLLRGASVKSWVYNLKPLLKQVCGREATTHSGQFLRWGELQSCSECCPPSTSGWLCVVQLSLILLSKFCWFLFGSELINNLSLSPLPFSPLPYHLPIPSFLRTSHDTTYNECPGNFCFRNKKVNN